MSKKNTITKHDFINRKAKFDFELLEFFNAGIKLEGTEIKSIRNGHVSFSDSYCYFIGHELYLKNLYIAEYDQAFANMNHEPKRDRKLLLTKAELIKLKKNVEEKRLTIVPTKVYIDKKGWAKVEISLARGKNKTDKRSSIKEKDIKRDTERSLKNY